MRKRIILCLALLLAVLPLAAHAEEVTECYVFAQWYPDQYAYADVSAEEADRLIVADTGLRMYTVALPEGAQAAEDFNYAGVKLVFDEPFTIERDGNHILAVDLPEGVLQPSAVEIVGIASYGPIVSLDEEHLTQTVWYDYNTEGDTLDYEGPEATYTITPDTLMCYEIPLEPGFGCMALVSDDGEVLLMAAGNG